MWSGCKDPYSSLTGSSTEAPQAADCTRASLTLTCFLRPPSNIIPCPARYRYLYPNRDRSPAPVRLQTDHQSHTLASLSHCPVHYCLHFTPPPPPHTHTHLTGSSKNTYQTACRLISNIHNLASLCFSSIIYLSSYQLDQLNLQPFT